MRSYLKELDDKKPVILCGDLNVAHQVCICIVFAASTIKSGCVANKSWDTSCKLLVKYDNITWSKELNDYYRIAIRNYELQEAGSSGSCEWLE